jgi:hypothetical protein
MVMAAVVRIGFAVFEKNNEGRRILRVDGGNCGRALECANKEVK